MRRFIALLAVILASCSFGSPALADAVGLQLAPLKYEQTITVKTPQDGFIDVGNPSDAQVAVQTSVQGFRQIDAAGDLSFFDDPVLSSAITPGLPTFTLGPRQAVRVAFTVDPAKLPLGGVYAAIFFQTVPENQAADNSYVSQSAKVGTLLILNNGGLKPVGGKIQPHLGWLQLGHGLVGQVKYSLGSGHISAEPKLSSQVYPWGKPTALPAGLVLPDTMRSFTFDRQGSYFGIIPVRIHDQAGGTATVWVLACTGWYQTLIAFLVALGVSLAWRRRFRFLPFRGSGSRVVDGLESKP